MKDLVLGAGLVGTHLAVLLKERGNDVRVLSRGMGHDLTRAENYNSDFIWAERVWFVAWDTGVRKADAPADYEMDVLEANTRLCQSVFGMLRQHKKPFLFVSSQAALSPDIFVLGTTKRLGETWARFLGGFVARFWNVYGWEPVGAKSHLVPDLVWKAMTEGSISLLSSGEETRQFLYVRDAVEALVYQFESGQKVADVTSGAWVSIKEMAQHISTLTSAKVITGENAGKPSLAIPQTPLVGWKPRFELNEGLQEVLESARLWKTKNL